MMTSSFNPRTPCGVRLPPPASSTAKAPFQSTHSLRSATRYAKDKDLRRSVSIHALLAECDMRLAGFCTCLPGFNPRTPCGVRHRANCTSTTTVLFQSTHSLRSATGLGAEELNLLTVSIHALLAECDCHHPHQVPQRLRFNPRTPCGVRLASRFSAQP